ncbi:hypothetical protein GIB67_030737 [Kingdonia uniflora]|uniref:Uncharacterized protein n=1 Tax=Kingdonia uniflora TaxID=39325 RepID=A0A7J7L312_9MAGN|nr:hypothetical protein GIB67_030737 [Kingdonia uniflora]
MKQHEIRDDVLQRPNGILASYGKTRGRIPELLSVHFWFHIDILKIFLPENRGRGYDHE